MNRSAIYQAITNRVSAAIEEGAGANRREVLRRDKRALVSGARTAARATDHLANLQPKRSA